MAHLSESPASPAAAGPINQYELLINLRSVGERHGEATRRRAELLRERAQALAIRTGYPEVFHRARSNHSASTSTTAAAGDPSDQLAPASKSGGAHEDSYPYHRRLSPEELAEFRVAITRGKELQAHRQALEFEQKRLQRSQLAGEAAPAQATQRLRNRREQLRRTAEAELDALVAQQDSSLDAMNIARLLSPRFQEHVSFAPSVVQYSAEDERVKHLLTNDRVGSYYQ
ncbi:hypothetical protein BBJ28_00000910 [Nothophytophthora sp. Chile5]|nr:hypothetical protein BBJ28_00000910 [Nothophytophthora sp. Chile5]